MIKESSDILSYKFDNTISKNEAISDLIENIKEVNPPKKSNYSTLVDTFSQNLPSQTIKEIDEGIDGAKKIIKENKDSIENKYADSVFSELDKDKVQEIIKENKNDINGSTHLEAILEMEKIVEQIEEIKINFKEFIYGQDIKSDELEDIDKKELEVIKRNEEDNNYSYNNYFMIYKDTQISNVIKNTASNMLLEIVDLNYFKLNNDKKESTENQKKILARNFNIIKEEQDRINFKDDSFFIELKNSMNNVFVKKNDLNIYNKTFSSMYLLGEDVELFQDLNSYNYKELDVLFEDFLKANMKIKKNKTDKIKNILNKGKIRSFF